MGIGPEGKRGAEAHEFGGRRFAVGHADTAPRGGTASHLHEEIEIVYVKGGSLRLHVDEEGFDLSAGMAVIVPPHLPHRAEPLGDGPCPYGTVCFHPLMFAGCGYRRFVRPLMLDGKSYTLKLSGDAAWQAEALRILHKLAGFHDAKDMETCHLEIHGLIFVLWNRIYNYAYADTPAIHAYEKLYRKMLRAIDYMHDHYQEAITDNDLAEQVSMSVGTFCRYFKQLMGVTPFQYLNKRRILQSRVLLSNTDRKVSDIAFQCGYNNLSLFNREFKKYMSCTPSEYRRGAVREREIREN